MRSKVFRAMQLQHPPRSARASAMAKEQTHTHTLSWKSVQKLGLRPKAFIILRCLPAAADHHSDPPSALLALQQPHPLAQAQLGPPRCCAPIPSWWGRRHVCCASSGLAGISGLRCACSYGNHVGGAGGCSGGQHCSCWGSGRLAKDVVKTQPLRNRGQFDTSGADCCEAPKG